MKILTVDQQKYIILRWRDVEALVDTLASKIEATYRPTLIVGIQRGGATVAHLISDRLDIYNICTVGCRSRRGAEREIYQPLPLRRLTEHDVLLVDDVADSGKSMRYVVDGEISPKKPRSLRTATLHIKPWSEFTPDFYVKRIDGWISYPWERYEAAKRLLPQLLERHNSKGAKGILIRKVGLPEDLVERALKALKYVKVS